MAGTALYTPTIESFVIEGGSSLNGRIAASGNKNAALPILAACVLSAEPVTLTNVPRIRDVEAMVELLADLGADAEWTGPNEVRVVAAELAKTAPDEALASRIRASFLLAGPLLARFGTADMPLPGGDVIGRRRLDTHIHAFAALGADIESNGIYQLRTSGLVGDEIFLDEASVMGTENAVMAAVLARGETVIGNAACEPHVQDLCRFLVGLGARIEGIGSNVLRISGVEELHGGSYRICPDHIEIASFMGLAAVTEGEIWIDDVEPADLRPMEHHLRGLGIRLRARGDERPRRPSEPRDPRRHRRRDPEARGRARGRSSRRTAPRSRSSSRRRRGARSSSSRRCSRAASSSSTSSSTWARGSSCATRTASS